MSFATFFIVLTDGVGEVMLWGCLRGSYNVDVTRAEMRRAIDWTMDPKLKENRKIERKEL